LTCLAVFLLLLGAGIGAGWIQLGRLSRAAAGVQTDLQALWAHRSGENGLPPLEDVRALRVDLERLERELRSTQRATAWFPRILARQKWWPGLCSWGLLLDGCLGAAADLATTAWWVALTAESALEGVEGATTAGGPATQGEIADPLASALQALRKDHERLRRAQEALSRARQGFDALHHDPLIGSRRGESWADYLDLLSLGVEALIIAPEILKPEGERTCLLLIQNSDELRATGGFISSLAVLKLQGHRLASLRYLNSYDVEAYRTAHPPPPPPLREYMQAGVLLFRDANWSADYPTSAEVLATLFRSDMGEKVDAVAAVDTFFIQLLLAALGPLPVPQYNVTVTAENALETAIAFWEKPLEGPAITERQAQGAAWLEHRKDFGAAFLQALLERLANLSPQDVVHLARAIQQGIRGKHVMIWALNSPALQADLRRAGLDGGLRDSAGDYLLVVDSNVGWNKVDRNIERAVDYRLTMTAEGPRAKLCLTYRNLAAVQMTECVHRARYEDTYEALTKQCYWDYVRILVPWGSVLRSVQGAEWPLDVTSESGKASFGTLLVIPPGEGRTLCLEYDLPPGIIGAAGPALRSYHLLVQKQPGTAATRLEVNIALRDGGAFRAVTAPWALISAQEVSSSLQVSTDLDYALSWSPPKR